MKQASSRQVKHSPEPTQSSEPTTSSSFEIPEWLKLAEEIDYRYFILGEMLGKEERLSVIERMVDQSTGYEKKKLQDIKKIVGEIKKLRKQYDKAVGSQ